MNINPAPLVASKQGFAPVFQLVSDFQFAENQKFTAAQGNDILRLQVPAGNLRRKLYCWLYANASGGTYSATGEISFWNQESACGKLPMSVGGGNFGNQSLISVCTANGSNVQDCIGMFVANQADSQPSSLILQPFYIDGDFDRVSFSLLSTTTNITYIRVFLAMVSGT